MQFHSVHGKNIELSQDASCAVRTSSFNYGILFGKEPIKPDQKVTVEITEVISGWSGGLRYGFTNVDPSTHAQADNLPPYAIPNLSSKPEYYAVSLSEKHAAKGTRLSYYYTSQNTCVTFINNKPFKTENMAKIDVTKPVWLLLDVYGCTKGIRAVVSDSEAAPIEIFVRGPEAMEAFLVASRKGTKPVYRTRLMIVGQDRVGKTSLKKSLTGRRYDAKEVSTDGIDTADWCIINTGDTKPWKVYTVIAQDENETRDGSSGLEDEFARAIAHNIVQELWSKRLQKKNDGTKDASSSTGVVKQQTTKHPTDNQNEEDEKKELTSDKKEESVSANDKKTQLVMKDITEQVKEAVGQELVDRVLTMVSEMIKKLENGEEVMETTTTDQEIFMSIWDFAGQSVYYTTHQVFLTPRAIYIIVFNLTHDLNSQAVVQIRRGEGHNNVEWMKSELTNLDFINFWSCSIHAHTAEARHSTADVNHEMDNTTSLSPSVFLVGTHRGSLSDDKAIQWQIVEEKFTVIAESFQDKVYKGHFVGKFYAVENNIDDEEDEQVKLLRNHIVRVASKERYMGEHMPVSWLQFEQKVAEMVERGINFISLDQGKDICSRFGIQEDLDSMLHFYHDLGVIIYYGQTGAVDESLRNTIILKPQWLIDVFKRVITTKDIDGLWEKFAEAWRRLDKEGILEDSLINHMWCTIIAQKPALIGLMSKFDLLCERIKPKTLKPSEKWEKSYFVPSRLKDAVHPNDVYVPSKKDIVFYITFGGFLPDGLFQRIMTRAVRWSQEQGGREPKLYFRQARFYVDDEHDVILQMAPFRYACIKVIVAEVEIFDDSDDSADAAESTAVALKTQERQQVACSKVRHFLEFTLCDLRQLWMKRINFTFSIACPCNKTCESHGKPGCKEDSCRHFLSLDECLATNIVICDHRRIKTTKYKKWFPAEHPSPLSVPARVPITNEKDKEEKLPDWIKAAAKLLNAGPSGSDWQALAIKLGYKRAKVECFADEVNPAQELILDWIYSSGNTNLSVDMMLSYLEQMHRDDVIEVIHKAQGSSAPPPSVFISYNWGIQDAVKQLRDRIERAGFSCWMDIGQMGGGDSLYAKIDEGMRSAKVVLCCISPKYIVSEACNREVSLADLLKKPIIPIMFDSVPWPPPGGMSLAFARLLYVQMKGVGGHGGSGVQSDLEVKYQDVISRIRTHSHPQLSKGILQVNGPTSSDKTLPHDAVSRLREGRSAGNSVLSLQRQARNSSQQLQRSTVRNCLVCAIL